MRTKGEELRNTVEEELREATAANIMHALPSTAMNFKPVSTLYEEIDRKYAELVREKEASSKYKIESSAAEGTLADFQSSNLTIESFSTPAKTGETSQETPARKYEASISESKLNRIQHELEEYVAQSARLAKEKFETPLGSRVGTSVLKLLISERQIPVLNALTTAIPIAGPLLSILTDSIRTKASMLIGSTTDSIIAAAVDNNPPTLQDSIEASERNLSTAVLKDISANNTPISGVEETLARSNLAKLDAAERDFQIRLNKEKDLVRERNGVLTQELRAINTPSKPSVQHDDDALDRLGDKKAQKKPFQNQQLKFQRAVDRLIDETEKVEDPLEQNRILTRISDTVSKDNSLATKAESLAKVAELLNYEVVKKSFNEIGGKSNVVTGPKWTTDHLGPGDLRTGTDPYFKRKVKPIPPEPEPHFPSGRR